MRSKANPNDLPERRVSAFEMQRKPAAFQREALKQPVTVTSNGSPTIVAMSVEEYRRLKAGTKVGQEKARSGLDRRTAISVLKSMRAELQGRGIARLGLFGSVARNVARPTSDIDVVVSLGRKLNLIELGAVQSLLEEAFRGVAVDVVVEPIANVALRRAVQAERVDVF